MATPLPEEARAVVARLFDCHGASLYRYALMLLGNSAAAEDALQQVFTGLLRRGHLLRLENELHYLRRAVRNECYSTLRRKRLDEDRISSAPILEPVSPVAVSPDEILALQQALLGLSADQREVVHLHVFEGMTFREIAETAGESINTVASRYRYAIHRLNELLTRLPNDLPA